MKNNFLKVGSSLRMPKSFMVKVGLLFALFVLLQTSAFSRITEKDNKLNSDATNVQEMNSMKVNIISGTVTDGLSGDPLIGVNVVIAGTTTGVITDYNGNYTISVPDESALLEFSFIGYNKESVTVGTQSILDVILSPSIESLSEVVVVGYGTKTKTEITGSVASVAVDELNTGVNESVGNALQGRVTGVTVMQNSGSPGGGVEIRVRGNGSINDNSPLYVVDGLIVDDISTLNTADIDQMSVLKDAASAAIYGARGANGVVVITTKKGKRNEKVSVSFNTSHGVQSVWKLPTSLTAEERNTIHTEALTNDGTDASSSLWDYYNEEDNAVTRTDWFDEIFNTGYLSNSDLSLRGGSEKANYSFSLGYMNNKGTLEGTNFKRYNIRINTQFEPLKSLIIGENVSLVHSHQKYAQVASDYDGVLSAALFMFRDIPVYEDEENDVYGSPSGDFPNPVASLNVKNNHLKQYDATGNVYLEYEFFDIFTFRTDAGYHFNFYNKKEYTGVADGGGRGLDQSDLYQKDVTTNKYSWTNTLNGDKRIDKHHISGLVGMSIEHELQEYTINEATDFTSDDVALQYFDNATTYSYNVEGSATDYSLMSYFGRLSYSYDNKYMMAGNIRADGSSRFASSNRWGVFPSASAGWMLSRESFFDGLDDYVSNAKIRLSWGQLGNDKIDDYQYYSTIDSDIGSPTLDGASYSAVAQNSIANSSIKWEVTTQTDLGIDLGFFNNKLLLGLDIFDKETSDMLVQVPLVSSMGVEEAPYKNVGKVSNKGYDLGITYQNKDNDFKYDVTVNFSQVKNELVSMGIEGSNEIFVSEYKNSYVGRMAEGEPIGHFYVKNALGIFKSEEEINSYVDDDGNLIQPEAKPGDVKFEDVNGDGDINDDDRINGGSSFPDFTGSLNFSASYKGFDFNMLWSGSYGNKIFNGLKYGGVFMIGTDYNNSTEILDRWTEDNPDASLPRVTIDDDNNNKDYSTLYIEDGSYARMKYLTFGYTFSDNLITNSNISKLRLYVTMQNLITLTNYSGYDPEVGVDSGNDQANMFGVDKGTYPQAKAFIVGLNLNF